MTTTNAVRLEDKFNHIGVFDAIKRYRHPFFETYRYGFFFNFHIITPEGHAHDGLYDVHARV